MTDNPRTVADVALEALVPHESEFSKTIARKQLARVFNVLGIDANAPA